MTKPQLRQYEHADPRAQHVSSRRPVRRALAADGLPLWARPTLRRGLPGDGAPQSIPEALKRCPHVLARHRLVEPQAHRLELHSWTDAPGNHSCIGGWPV